jgi:glutaredoxin-like protein
MSKRVSREGSRVPDVELAELADGNVRKYGSRELFGGRKVILFALPGAFTPTCSTAHVPGYVAHLKEFRDAGIDDVVCLSVNDPFVMEAWQRSEKAQGIHFVADPFGEFTREMGMSIDHRDAGLGTRSWRYSMLVNDGVIEKMFIEPDEPGDPFVVSDADTMLDYVNPKAKKPDQVAILTRNGCSFCAKAKRLLTEAGIAYAEVPLDHAIRTKVVGAITGAQTVPQVFINGRLIGNAEDLERHLKRAA